MAYTYILKCCDSSYYTGSTKNLEQRLWQHQNGQGANHTKTRLPVSLIYVEYYDRVEEAFAREKQIQGWSRVKKEALINGNVDSLRSLSQCTLRQAQGTAMESFDRQAQGTAMESFDRETQGTAMESFDKLSEQSNNTSIEQSESRCLSLSKADV